MGRPESCSPSRRSFSEDNNGIVNNDISLMEATAGSGVGAEFFVSGDASVTCNTIFSDGDRYLDIDPDPSSPNRPTISHNKVSVKIRQGTFGSRGTMLELRGRDHDAGDPGGVNPEGRSGAFEVPSSPGFTGDPSENWVLEQLEIMPDAKVNLTNRPGFAYQADANHPETVYVKEVRLHANAVLNTGLQTLYYQTLVDENGAPLVPVDPDQPNGPFTNGSRIVDIPVLGFSLVNIAMENQEEFDIRVRKRLSDPNDYDPNATVPLPEGSIDRRESVVPGDPNQGVMVMETQSADPNYFASSIAAKGAFARAGNEKVTVVFEYLFCENPGAELIVYISDHREVGVSNTEIARIYPPASGRPGAIGSDRFAIFQATFPKGVLNFTRGSYVELELRGENARCWIDNWDPRIMCWDTCGDVDITPGVSYADYLLLLVAISGQPIPGYSDPDAMWCLDVVTDGYVDWGDLLSWETGLNLCSAFTGEEESEGRASTAKAQSDGPGWGDGPLLIAGKSGAAGDSKDYLYWLDPNDGCVGPKQPATVWDPNYDNRGNGRLVMDGEGTIYQLHGGAGLVRSTGEVIVAPQDGLTHPNTPTSEVLVGMTKDGDDDWQGVPLLDAAFDPNDPNVVYVVPVLVRPSGVTRHYKAAAKLRLQGDGDYDLLEVYGRDPATYSTVQGDPNVVVFWDPDYQQGRELELDAYGNVYVLSAQAFNGNDYVLVYDPNGTELDPVPTVSPNVPAPVSMHVSAHDPTTLYLASSVNDPNSANTAIYRFTIDGSPVVTGLTLDADGVMAVTNMRHVTSIAEDPSTGTLYVLGLMAPTFDPDGGDYPDEDDPLFTTATLAEIPAGTDWSVVTAVCAHCIGCSDPNGCVDPNGCQDPNADLALPISAVFVPPPETHTLKLVFQHGENGTASFDPDVLQDPNGDPNDPNLVRAYAAGTVVTLTAAPYPGKSFSKWRIFDPNDANLSRNDTNAVISLTMDADYEVSCQFACGSGVGQALPLLVMVGVLCGLGSLRRRRAQSEAIRSAPHGHDRAGRRCAR